MILNRRDFDYLRRLVRKRSAITLGDDKAYLVETRLMPLVRREQFASLGELVEQMRRHPSGELHQQVVEAMTTNETSFFRDRHPFETLRRHVFPALLAPGRARPINIWCAACSTGQEPYSIAILLREHFPMLKAGDVHILATDLSTGVLERAQKGCYSKFEVRRGLPAPLLAKYFEEEGPFWRVKEPLRRMVEFRPLNLIERWPALPAMDVLFLRNVLIYFDTATKQDILSRVRRVLKPEGYLFLGSSETTLNVDEAFERVSLGSSYCYRATSSLSRQAPFA